MILSTFGNSAGSIVAIGCLGLLITLYAVAVGILVLGQRRLLFRPKPPSPPPESAGAVWMTPVRQGKSLLGWYAPPSTETAPVLVFFHGNRGTLERVAAKTATWRQQGMGIFAATYRGYEGNPGLPSEEGLYEDGRAVLDWLAGTGISENRIILYGESLGSGIATQLANERRFRAVILEAPFSSITDIAAARYPWVPCRWLLRDRFDNLSRIGNIAAPMLILHGSKDSTVPTEHAHILAKAAPRARLVLISNANHLNLHDQGGTPPLLAFIEAL
jgi:hypothetical protein